MFILETERLRLRDMRLDDEAAFVAITQDERYQRFYSEEDGRAQKYRELTRLFVEQAGERPRRAYQLAIEHKATNALIGTVCLRLESDQQASMGCGMVRHGAPQPGTRTDAGGGLGPGGLWVCIARGAPHLCRDPVPEPGSHTALLLARDAPGGALSRASLLQGAVVGHSGVCPAAKRMVPSGLRGAHRAGHLRLTPSPNRAD